MQVAKGGSKPQISKKGTQVVHLRVENSLFGVFIVVGSFFGAVGLGGVGGGGKARSGEVDVVAAGFALVVGDRVEMELSADGLG